MSQHYTRSYTSGHVVAEDGSVDFDCATDQQEWTWLALPPRHPAAIQTQNFWASIGAGIALGTVEEGKWTALTWTDWTCGDPEAEHAVRGHHTRTMVDGQDCYDITLFDQKDRLVAQMRGRGVVFRNRNFEEWRSQAKAKTKSEAERAGADEPFTFADPDSLGLMSIEQALVAPLAAPDAGSVDALVTRENGLQPNNPVLGGSGDHVNSTHIAEAARQALRLVSGDPQLEVTGGEMSLNRYVELGTPFRLDVIEKTDSAIRFSLSQLGKDCSEITLRFES